MYHSCTQMQLTLQLPLARTAEVIIMYADGSKPPALHSVEVLKSGSVGSLYAALAKVWSPMLCCRADQIVGRTVLSPLHMLSECEVDRLRPQALGIASDQADSLLLLVEIIDMQVDRRYGLQNSPIFSAACACACVLWKSTAFQCSCQATCDDRFMDMNAPVADALGDDGKQCTAPVLIAYRYPSAELGPRSTVGEEVTVSLRYARLPCRWHKNSCAQAGVQLEASRVLVESHLLSRCALRQAKGGCRQRPDRLCAAAAAAVAAEEGYRAVPGLGTGGAPSAFVVAHWGVSKLL